MDINYHTDEYRSYNKIPMDRWRKLYEVAIQIRDAAPWEWLGENDSFGIEDQLTGWSGYTCSMGELGTYLGIHLYLGIQGYYNFLEILTLLDPSYINHPILMEQDCLALSFGSRQELAARERALVKRLELKLQGPNAYPSFRRHEPGFFPWFISPTEAEFLERALPVFLDTALQLQKKTLQIPMYPKLLLQTIRPDGSVYSHEVEVPKKRTRKRMPKYVYDELALKRTMNNCVKGEQEWEVGYFRSPEAVKENRKSRPFFPETLLFADRGSGIVLDVDMFKNKSDLFQSLIQKLQLIMDLQNECPARILTRQAELKRILSPALKPYGIKITLTRSMPVWEEIFHALYQQILESMDSGT